MNVVRTTHRHNRNEGIESCNVLSWQVPTLTYPCCASARCVRLHGNLVTAPCRGSVIVGLNTIEQVDGLVAAAADAETDSALVEDVHALWENE